MQAIMKKELVLLDLENAIEHMIGTRNLRKIEVGLTILCLDWIF